MSPCVRGLKDHNAFFLDALRLSESLQNGIRRPYYVIGDLQRVKQFKWYSIVFERMSWVSTKKASLSFHLLLSRRRIVADSIQQRRMFRLDKGMVRGALLYKLLDANVYMWGNIDIYMGSLTSSNLVHIGTE